ncbi:MAG: hypothetical protein IPJ65_20535 [Archangiaceae bacterium]|nr:hypothetical protein [Archangiaceae bacterium]
MRRPTLGFLLVAACSGAQPDPVEDAGPLDSGARDAGSPRDAGSARDAGARDSGTFDAGAPPFVPPLGPLTIKKGAGSVLSDAWLVTLSHSDVPADARIAELGDYLPDSGWLRAVGDGYGVGIIGHTHYAIPRASPSMFTNLSVSTLIDEGIDAGWWPARPSDAGTLVWLAVYGPNALPENHFSGEHFANGARVLGWVAPRADGGAGWYQTVLAHEVIEALTDPRFNAYFTTSDPLFNYVPGGGNLSGEVADLCQRFPAAEERGFWLPPSWSNRAAEAGRRPCVPLAPAQYGTLWGPTAAVVLSPGQSVDVALPAVGDLASWDVQLAPAGNQSDFTDVTLRSTRATPGTPLVATFRAHFFAAPGSVADFLLVSAADSGYPGVTPLRFTVR